MHWSNFWVYSFDTVGFQPQQFLVKNKVFCSWLAKFRILFTTEKFLIQWLFLSQALDFLRVKLEKLILRSK